MDIKAILGELNGILEKSVPLITTAAPIVGGVISLVEKIIADVRAKGTNIEGFDVEIARYRAVREQFTAKNDQWWAEVGLSPPEEGPLKPQPQGHPPKLHS